MTRPQLRPGGTVLAVDGFYLFKVGAALAPLDQINAHTPCPHAWLSLFVASGELNTFINDSVYRPAIRNSRAAANALLELLKQSADIAKDEDNKDKVFGDLNSYRLQNALKDFQAVASAEFSLTPLFLVTPKKGLDLMTLVYQGQTFFPDSLALKAPEAIEDLRLGTRCLAFELVTAAAFHFNRANEAVLRRYWEAKCPGKPHPGNKTIADYLRALGKARRGSPKVKGALRDIKDLYRNPVLHPEYHLKDVDEAIALQNTIHTAIVHMLSEMPDAVPPTASSAGAVASP